MSKPISEIREIGKMGIDVFPQVSKIEHETNGDGKCWCEPVLNYEDEFTKRKVWVHKSDEELNQ